MGQLGAFLVLAVLCPLAAHSQTRLTISQAVEGALRNYPAVRASIEQARAASSGIDLARTAYLPRADFAFQANRATRNNVFGLLLPQPVIPSMSGPVLGTNDLTTVWGSAAGMLLSWEPFDFGLRRAGVGIAEAAYRRAEASRAVTEFEVSARAADSFLTTVAAQQRVVAFRAGVERARVLDTVVAALAKAGLRPGADAARTRAELAAAETQLIQAEEVAAVSKVALAELLAAAPSSFELDSGPLLAPAPEPAAAPSLEEHPAARAQNAVIEQAKARERALARSYFPRFNIQGATYARGTGALVNGAALGGLNGLAPNFQNWALGLTVLFPAFDLASIRARRKAELHQERAEQAQYDRVLRDLAGGVERAKAQLEGARRIAANTPVQVEAARAANDQATARYKSGLGAVIEVAETQRLLTQAEIDDAVARLAVWRAMLGLAAAQGELGPFLKAATK